jgi:hypothetical protein
LMGSSTNRNYTPVGRFFYILISMLHLFLNSETLVESSPCFRRRKVSYLKVLRYNLLQLLPF